jgi:nitrogen fixation protein NifU and related proteins
VMEHPDLTGMAGTPGSGPFMILCLRVADGRITESKFQTYGCGPAIAAGSVLTEIIVGRTIEECRELTAEQLIEALDGVPPDKLHCPALAIAALKHAIGEHLSADYADERR